MNSPIGAAGFSLVEMLVVVAIIITLLGILGPTIDLAITDSQTISCASNLRQQGVGMLAYVTEYRYFPHHVGASAGSGWVPSWPTRLRLFTGGSNDPFYCPSQFEGWIWREVYGTGAGFATQWDVLWLGYKQGEKLLTLHSTPFSYGINDWGACGAFCEGGKLGLGGDPGWAPQTLSSIVQPGQMIAIGDNTSDGSWDFNIDPTNPREYPGRIHEEGANILYVDGHVEWNLQSDLVLNPAWPPSAWVGENLELSKRWNATYQRTP